MRSIADIRQQYPQYNDLSDKELANKLHDVYYQDMPIDEFYSKIGLKTAKTDFNTPQRQSFEDKLQNALHRYGNLMAQGLHKDANMVRGFRDAIANTATDLVNTIPGINVPLMKTAEGPQYDVGQVAGNVAAFMGGGEGAEALRGMAKGMPYISKLAHGLEGSMPREIAKRALGAAGFGAITSPEDRTEGALTGAATSALSDILLGSPQILRTLGRRVNPSMQAEELRSSIGANKSQEENAKDVAQNVHDAYMSRIGEAHELYRPVFDNLGSRVLYDGINPSSYLTLDKDVLSSYDKDLRNLHNQFGSNPTLENAHQLRRQLNNTIYGLENKGAKSGLDMAERNELSDLKQSRSSLTSDIMDFLNREDPAMSVQYQRANEYWKDHAVPYQLNKKLYALASGDVKNPRSLGTIFKNPEDNMLKVLQDLPKEARDKIINEKLGKFTLSDPKKLVSAFHKLDEQGLGEYITPELKDKIDKIEKADALKNLLQRGAGAVGAAALTHGSLPLELELASGALGGVIAPTIFKTAAKAKKLLPTDEIGLLPALQKAAIAQAARGDSNGS